MKRDMAVIRDWAYTVQIWILIVWILIVGGALVIYEWPAIHSKPEQSNSPVRSAPVKTKITTTSDGQRVVVDTPKGKIEIWILPYQPLQEAAR